MRFPASFQPMGNAVVVTLTPSNDVVARATAKVAAGLKPKVLAGLKARPLGHADHQLAEAEIGVQVATAKVAELQARHSAAQFAEDAKAMVTLATEIEAAKTAS